MLGRQGIVMNLKKLRRLYREEKLMMRKRSGRKWALGTRRPLALPSRPNERWSLDFVSDAFTDGRRFRVLAVVDDFTRECLCLIADTSLSGARLARELDSLIARRGKPKTIVSDNGTEMTSMVPSNGARKHVSNGITSPPASRCRTVSSRVPTAASETNASTRPCSRRSPTHAPLSGGLQQKQTALIAWQHHSQRVRNENGYGKTGRMRPD
jgi:hypothetical protein